MVTVMVMVVTVVPPTAVVVMLTGRVMCVPQVMLLLMRLLHGLWCWLLLLQAVQVHHSSQFTAFHFYGKQKELSDVE